MRRAEAGETISQEEVKAAVRISRADCAPVTLPPRPAAKGTSIYRNRGSPSTPTKEPPPMVDLREVGERSAGRYIAHDLK